MSTSPLPQTQATASPPTWRAWAFRLAPLAALLLMAVWAWRVWDPVHQLPNDPGRSPMGYGDVLEVTWGLQWYYDALILRAHPLDVYPGIFAPDGWQVGTLAHGPGLFIAFMPFVSIGGPALAYTLSLWVAFALTYFGTYRLARRFVDRPWAIAVALFVTFWGYRWMRLGGQPNILLGAGLLPWLIECFERGRSTGPRAWVWAVFGGLLWGYAVTCSLYFAWLGAVTLGAWVLGVVLSRSDDRGQLVRAFALMDVVAFAVSLPYLLWFQAASSQAGAATFDLAQLSGWGASVNAMLVPFARHPLELARSLNTWAYHGAPSESGTLSLGPVAFGLGLVGFALARRERNWWPVCALTFVGMALSLGPYLRWDDQLIQIEHPVVRMLNTAIWTVGHAVKPGLFAETAPPDVYARAIPLPAIVPLMFVPFWEGARISARYALVGGIGLYLLAIWAATRTRRRWLTSVLIVVLAIEWWPAPTYGVPYPLTPHPVFAWVSANTAPDAVVADLFAATGDHVELRIKPQTLTATLFHGRAALSGTSSVLPAHAADWQAWLAAHPTPFADPGFADRLRADHVGVILIHVVNPQSQALADSVAADPAWHFVDCVDPTTELSPWPYPICIVTP